MGNVLIIGYTLPKVSLKVREMIGSCGTHVEIYATAAPGNL